MFIITMLTSDENTYGLLLSGGVYLHADVCEHRSMPLMIEIAEMRSDLFITG